MQNKAENYRRMLAYLENLGADLGPHTSTRLASVDDADFMSMDRQDILHYQRILEATIDNRDGDLMDGEALKDELTEVMRERFAKGGVIDKTAEARGFRARLAGLGTERKAHRMTGTTNRNGEPCGYPHGDDIATCDHGDWADDGDPCNDCGQPAAYDPAHGWYYHIDPKAPECFLMGSGPIGADNNRRAPAQLREAPTQSTQTY